MADVCWGRGQGCLVDTSQLFALSPYFGDRWARAASPARELSPQLATLAEPARRGPSLSVSAFFLLIVFFSGARALGASPSFSLIFSFPPFFYVLPCSGDPPRDSPHLYSLSGPLCLVGALEDLQGEGGPPQEVVVAGA